MMTENETLFDHIPAFHTYLKEVRDTTIKTVDNSEHIPSVSKALDAAMGVILAELSASIPSTRWVLMEYVAGGIKDGELEENTRPAKFSVHDYWEQVSS